MTLFILAWLAGILTIASPCIFPVLPFVLARSDQPFRRGALPMLLGLAIAFAAQASLASVAGGWAVAASRDGRHVALALMALFGLAMLLPHLAVRLSMPIVALGNRLTAWREQRATTAGATLASSIILGVATGFVWAPCAGPVLGLILTAAALRGPGIGTSLLLLAYGLGAAAALAAGVLFGGRLLAWARLSVQWSEGPRRILGAAVMVAAAAIWFGADTTLLTPLSVAGTTALENRLLNILRNPSAMAVAAAAETPPVPALSAPLAALLSARSWLNTSPLLPADLRGKVVLVNFWTYSCINCLRTLPYIRAWAEKYRDQGLVVVGVETPEFAFEKDLENVRSAVLALGLSYPVAIDNDFAIWRAFDNNAWPAFYFIGADGRIHHRIAGEGQYADSERLIQQLLSDANGTRIAADIVSVDGTGSQAAPSLPTLQSPETYLGYSQASNFLLSRRISNDTATLYKPASPLPLNHWTLAGVWNVGAEFATLDQPSGAITYRFHARDLNLVLATQDQTGPVRFRIKVDGRPPGPDHGVDVDPDGWGTARQARLYQLVRQSGPVTDRTFEIEFLDPGVRVYTFTFG